VKLGPQDHFFLSSVAKLIASASTYPHEVMRTRLREQVTTRKYKGVISGLILLGKEEGIAGLYGVCFTFLFAFLCFRFVFASFY
jgi:solute carrier family 25 protein 33/36